MREFLEKNHKDDLTKDETIKLAIKSLLEVVQTGAKNIEIAVMEGHGKVRVSSTTKHSVRLPTFRSRSIIRLTVFLFCPFIRTWSWPRLKSSLPRSRKKRRLRPRGGGTVSLLRQVPRQPWAPRPVREPKLVLPLYTRWP